MSLLSNLAGKASGVGGFLLSNWMLIAIVLAVGGTLGYKTRDVFADRSIATARLATAQADKRLADYQTKILADTLAGNERARKADLVAKQKIAELERQSRIRAQQRDAASKQLQEFLHNAQNTDADRPLGPALLDYVERLRKLQAGSQN